MNSYNHPKIKPSPAKPTEKTQEEKPSLAKLKNDDPHVHTEEPCNGPMCLLMPIGGIITAISGATPVQEASEMMAQKPKQEEAPTFAGISASEQANKAGVS
jgi:hypothetical protein